MQTVFTDAGPWLLGAAAAVTAATVLGVAARRVLLFARRIGHFLDDVSGEPARPGVPARAGLMERVGAIETRLGTVEHEVQTNDGGSLKDSARRTERAVDRLRDQVNQLNP